MPALHHDIYIRTNIYIYCVNDFCGVYRLVGSCLVMYCAVFLITVVKCHLWLWRRPFRYSACAQYLFCSGFVCFVLKILQSIEVHYSPQFGPDLIDRYVLWIGVLATAVCTCSCNLLIVSYCNELCHRWCSGFGWTYLYHVFFQAVVRVGYLQHYSFYVSSKMMWIKFLTLCYKIMCNLYNLQFKKNILCGAAWNVFFYVELRS